MNYSIRWLYQIHLILFFLSGVFYLQNKIIGYSILAISSLLFFLSIKYRFNKFEILVFFQLLFTSSFGLITHPPIEYYIISLYLSIFLLTLSFGDRYYLQYQSVKKQKYNFFNIVFFIILLLIILSIIINNEFYGKFSGFYKRSNDFSLLLISLASLTCLYIVTCVQRNMSILSVILFLCIIVMSSFSGSRLAAIALTLFALLTLFSNNRVNFKVSILLCVFIFLILLQVPENMPIFEKFQARGKFENDERLVTWIKSLDILRWLEYSDYNGVFNDGLHNGALQVAAKIGIIPAIIFFLEMFYLLVKRMKKIPKHQGYLHNPRTFYLISLMILMLPFITENILLKVQLSLLPIFVYMASEMLFFKSINRN